MQAIGRGGSRTQAGLEWPAPMVVLETLAGFIPPETIRSVLTQTGRQSQRIRRLPATAVVWLAIAIGLWTDLDIPAIWRQVFGTLRSLFLALDAKHPPCKSALSQARTRLGPWVMRQLVVVTSAPECPLRSAKWCRCSAVSPLPFRPVHDLKPANVGTGAK